MELFKGKKRFVLIGHSFGAVLGIKLAKILEQNGLTGEVICSDGAVALLKQGMKMHVPQRGTVDESIKHFILMQFVFETLPDMKLDEIQKVLNEKKTFDDQIDTFIELIPKSVYSKLYLKNFVNGLCNRMKMILNENDKFIGERIQSNITLIRPSVHFVTDIENDYNLKKYTDGQVDVNFVEGNHLSMLDHSEIYQICNIICAKSIQK